MITFKLTTFTIVFQRIDLDTSVFYSTSWCTTVLSFKFQTKIITKYFVNIIRAWEVEMTKSRNGSIKRSPNLLWVLLTTFGREYLMRLGPILGSLDVLFMRIGPPLFLWQLIRYFSAAENEDGGSANYWQIYLYATGIVFGSLSVVLHFHPNYFASTHTAMRMRIAVSSLIYRKV